jgi:cation diffusion facilitator family transporter
MGSIRIQRNIALLSVVLFIGKMLAWYLTHSVTILTDALESIVNVVAGFLGLFSITLAARPRDTNHPYGHGKAEFLSSAVEGTLILVSGLVIIYEAVRHLIFPHKLEQLNTGLIIILITGAINFFVGQYAEKAGNSSKSMVLVSAGKHLKTDAYSTVAIVIGLALLLLTGNKWMWLDSVVALSFAVIVIVTGYKVLRKSLSGIMDETDVALLKSVISVMQKNRLPQWVDLHNLRVIHYGVMMHIDAHMTLPWYYTVAQAHAEIQALEQLMRSHFGDQVELFIHIDGCLPYQCKLCALEGCPVRQETFKHQVEWNIDNVWANARHGKGPGNPES